jgi:hypothetical protein
VFQPRSSNSFEVLAVTESFWQLYSTIFVGGVDNGREENCSLFDTFFFAVFGEDVKRGIFNKKRNYQADPGEEIRHLRLGFLLANGLLLGSRSNEQIKTQS